MLIHFKNRCSVEIFYNMKYYLTVLFSLFYVIALTQNANAGKPKLTGKIICEQTQQPLDFTTVVLIDKANTRKPTGVMTDNKGYFELIAEKGKYKLEISLIGYEKYQSEIELMNDMNIGEIRLKTTNKQLAEVEVKSRPIVNNAEGFSILVGATEAFKGLDLYDILRTSPGIWINNNNLTVYGNTVSKVYINERELKLSGADLLEYLRLYDQKNIRKIDVILSSGVEDDAESAGKSILKITTNKIEDGGLARFSLSSVLGSEGNYYTPSGNVNLRKGKFSGYLMSSFPKGKKEKKQNSVTEFYQSGNMVDETMNYTSQVDYNLPITVGLGYDISARHMVSVEARLRESQFVNLKEGNSVTTSSGNSISSNKSLVSNKNRNSNLNMSANYVYLPKNGGKLVVKADYFNNNAHSVEMDSVLQLLSSTEVSTNTDNTQRKFYSASVDYSGSFRGKKDVLAVGSKYYCAQNRTDMSYIVTQNNVYSVDKSFDDLFNYNENVFAAYIKYDLNLTKLNVSTGLRMEATKVDPRSKTYPEKNHVSEYTDFFPAISVGYSWDKNKNYYSQLSYRSSLSRPYFGYLNPGVTSKDNFFYTIGNPYLKPSYSRSVSLRTVFFDNYTLAAACYKGRDDLNENVYRDSISDIIYNQYQNMASSNGWSITGGGTQKIFKKITLSLLARYNHSVTLYPDKTYANDCLSYGAQTNIEFPKGFRFMGQIMGATASYKGNSKVIQKPDVQISLNRNFFNNKLSVNISVTDLLNSGGRMRRDYYSPDFYQRTNSGNNSVRFGIGISYGFKWGNKSIKVNRVEAGNQDEQSRVGSDN